jgi:hypothetical protein
MPPARDQVFISYSHKDREWLELLQTMLKPLVRKNSVSVWDDTNIKAGAKWKEEIERALGAAKVAVLIVTHNFLNSDFIAEHELPPLLDAAAKEGLIILWIYASSCLFDETEIGDYQAAHDISKPLNSLTPAKRSAVLVEVCRKIKAAANVVGQSPEAEPRAVSQELPANVHSESQRQAKAEKARMSLPEKWVELCPKPRELSGGYQWNVYLSYRSVDRAWVLNLYDVLRHQGHKVFFDQCVLKAGDDLVQRFDEALRTSQSAVLVWSTGIKHSDWIFHEYVELEHQAMKKTGFQFVPVRLDTGELPLFAQSRFFIDFSAIQMVPMGVSSCASCMRWSGFL